MVGGVVARLGVVPAVAAACVVALVAVLVLPAGDPRASVPAVQVDSDGIARLTAYPDVIAKPPFLPETARPGVTAAIVPGPDQVAPVFAVSAGGVVSRVPLPPDESGLLGTPSLSPNGRWVARGPVLTDLVSGAALSRQVPTRPGSRGPGRRPRSPRGGRRTPAASSSRPSTKAPRGPAVWSSAPTDRPPRCRSSPEEWYRSVAGWLDDATLLVLLDLGPGTSRLEGRTWRVGDDAWRVSDADVEWSTGDELEASGDEIVRASLSPDGSRLLVTRSVSDPEPTGLQTTRAMMFDPGHRRPARDAGRRRCRRPRRLGPREATSSGAAGAAVRLGARDLPVVTDGGVRGFVDTDPNGLVDGRRRP